MGGVLLAASLALALGAAVDDQIVADLGIGEAPLRRVWERDLKNLKEAGKLPKEFQQIRDLELVATDPETRERMKNISIPINETPDGNYRLEIFVDPWRDGREYGILVQYHLVEIANQNTVWELGRSYKIGDKAP